MGRVPADTSVFYAVADPTRRAILDVLRDGEQSVMVMLERLRETFAALGQSAFSQHLAVLRSSGLVTSRKFGRKRLYAISPEPLSEIATWVGLHRRPSSSRSNSQEHCAEVQSTTPT
ncbi:MAG: winged helix-turn-helix transcriptional regulator [Planctomycetes bacterium]|nr:winged helix-turn-helix transcriptional regulator [Planctomycetota bacterium]